MPFLSIIIPVYNVEPYLHQCVDSVIEQQLEDYELILVDDGSPDNCPKICDDYALKYPQVCAIHQKNGGLSAARNAGLLAATGKYVAFIDSDDWWNTDVNVNNMLDYIKGKPNIDIFLFAGLDYIEGKGFFERNDSIRSLAGNVFDAPSYYIAMLAMGNLQVSAATKIIKRSFLLNNNLFFKSGLRGEDNEWMIRVLRCKPSIEVLADILYVCRIGRQGSISNSIGKGNVSDLLQIVRASQVYYSENDADQTVKEYELCFCAYLWFCALGLSGSINRTEYRELISAFRATSEVCRFSSSKKTRLSYALTKAFGINGARLFLNTYLRLHNRVTLNKKKKK